MSKRKVKVKGGMDKNWISTLRKDPRVEAHIVKKGEEFKRSMETKIDAKAAGRFQGPHFGSAEVPSGWGKSFVIWAISPTAQNAKAEFITSLKAFGFTKKKKSRGKK